jgi:hypothetical protein
MPRFLVAAVLAALVVAAPAQASWTKVVNDRFDSGGVPDHWHLYDGPYGSDPHNCASPSHASVSDGYLHMRMSYEQSGPCGAGWYTAGMMLDKAFGAVDQRVAVKWRIVPDGVSSHRIIPMRFPNDDPWPAGGEQDLCEGGGLDGCSTFLHYGDVAPGEQVWHPYGNLDLTNWHVMGFVVKNNAMSSWIDNWVTPAWLYWGTATTLPDTVKRVVLQQECHPAGCPDTTTGSEDIQIDWITVSNWTPDTG